MCNWVKLKFTAMSLKNGFFGYIFPIHDHLSPLYAKNPAMLDA